MIVFSVCKIKQLPMKGQERLNGFPPQVIKGNNKNAFRKSLLKKNITGYPRQRHFKRFLL